MISWDFNNVWRWNGTPKSFSLTTKWKWPFKKGLPNSVRLLIVSMPNYTDQQVIIIANTIPTKKLAKTSHAKVWSGTIMQEATPNVINLSSKWAPLKWGLISIKPTCGLIHQFSLSIHFFNNVLFESYLLLGDSGTNTFALTEIIERWWWRPFNCYLVSRF